MVLKKKKFHLVIWKAFDIVRFVVLLSLIPGTHIYGKNAANIVAKEKENFLTRLEPTRSAEPEYKLAKEPSVVGESKGALRVASNSSGSGSKGAKALARRQTEDRTDSGWNGPCRNFVVDVAVRNEFEFYSPGNGPNQPYPSQMDCVKTITAPPGHLLRLDFRNEFHLEQSEDCRFDYLEIRDGAHGYSNLIGSYCGNRHPPPITSSDRHLWLRFASDENIQYSGFHAVYWYIPRPTNSDQHPEMDVCQIEVSGNEGFANRSDINENRIRLSTTYGLPLDCMWIISVEQGWKIMLQFLKFRLEKPNDCESNFVDVFSDRTDLPSRLKNFCGSIADSVISKSNILHLRFFAEARSINSTFEALFTAFREKPRDEACEEDEYDCEDATCISIDLRCNGRINCRFRWDEDECQPKLGAFAVILESEHIIIILVVFCLILSGMCFAFLFNCTKKLIRDHRIIQEHLRQSKENEINAMSGGKEKTPGTESKSGGGSGGGSSSSGSFGSGGGGGTFGRESVKTSPSKRKVSEGERDFGLTGDIIPIYPDRENGSEEGTSENFGVSGSGPEMKDSECQTRESLFSTPSIESNAVRGFIPSLVAASDHKIHPKRTGNNSNKIPPFSTFGYAKTNESGRSRPEISENETFGLPRFYESERVDGKRYKAEAVIEVESRKRKELTETAAGAATAAAATAATTTPNAVRPFSIDSTKSAPDVIVTH